MIVAPHAGAIIMADSDRSAATASTYVSTEIPSSKRRRRYGFTCAVAECSNNHGKGYTLHKFPDDTETRRQWIKFVQTCRANFGPKFGTPNQNSKICSSHFSSDCYPAKVALAASFGMKTSSKLVPKSVPTVQKPLAATAALSTVTKSSRSTVTSVSRARCTVTDVTMAITTPICITTVGQSVSRGVFAKRERQRLSVDRSQSRETVSVCDRMETEQHSHETEFKIEIDVAEEPPLAWCMTQQQPQSVERSQARQTVSGCDRMEEEERTVKIEVETERDTQEPPLGRQSVSQCMAQQHSQKTEVKTERDTQEPPLGRQSVSQCMAQQHSQKTEVKTEVKTERDTQEPPLGRQSVSQCMAQQHSQKTEVKIEVKIEIDVAEEPPLA
ncbi:uncharacterized protein [Littorina saxatilis]|uniref:uncharacterized protein n=1 Tax=Littorina saxatilis TaxID=31220 RepID=UPI0038B54208